MKCTVKKSNCEKSPISYHELFTLYTTSPTSDIDAGQVCFFYYSFQPTLCGISIRADGSMQHFKVDSVDEKLPTYLFDKTIEMRN